MNIVIIRSSKPKAEHSLMDLVSRASLEMGMNVYDDNSYDWGLFDPRETVFCSGMTKANEISKLYPSAKIIGVEQGFFYQTSMLYFGLFANSPMSNELWNWVNYVPKSDFQIKEWINVNHDKLNTKHRNIAYDGLFEYANAYKMPEGLEDFIFLPLQYPFEVSFAKYNFDYYVFLDSVAKFCSKNKLPIVLKIHPHYWHTQRDLCVSDMSRILDHCESYIATDDIREIAARSRFVITADSLPVMMDAAMAGSPSAHFCPSLFDRIFQLFDNVEFGLECAMGWHADSKLSKDILREYQRKVIWVCYNYLLFDQKKGYWDLNDYSRIKYYLEWYANQKEMFVFMEVPK